MYQCEGVNGDTPLEALLNSFLARKEDPFECNKGVRKVVKIATGETVLGVRIPLTEDWRPILIMTHKAMRKRFLPENYYKRFRKFHRENPHVFRLFCQVARELQIVGERDHYGARAIGERMRFHTSLKTTDPVFKLNNNHWPYYTRLLMLQDPTFRGFFEYRGGGGDVTDDQLLRECGNERNGS